jgi:hypothetical protein
MKFSLLIYHTFIKTNKQIRPPPSGNKTGPINSILHLLTQMGIISHTPRKHVAYFSPSSWNVGLHLNLAMRPLDTNRTRPFMRSGSGHLFLFIGAENTQSFHWNLHMESLFTDSHRKPNIVTSLFYTTSTLTLHMERWEMLIMI